MINLLSKQDRRYLIILETLYKKQATTLSFLMDVTQTSRRIVREDFAVINSFMAPMTIKTSVEGCELTYPQNFGNEHIYSTILINSLEYSFLEMVFFEKEKRLEEYADALYISVTKLRRIIRNINTVVEKYKFKISTDPIQLIGDEVAICNTIFGFFKEKYPHYNYPFSQSKQDTIEKLIAVALTDFKFFDNFSDIDVLNLFLLIATVRIQNGHVPAQQPKVYLSRFDMTFLTEHYFKTVFHSVFQFELSIANFSYLFYPFINGEFAFIYEDVAMITQTNPRKQQLMSEVEYFLRETSDIYNIKLSNFEHIKWEIFNLDSLSLESVYLLYDKKKVFCENLGIVSSVVKLFMDERTERMKQLLTTLKPDLLHPMMYILITHWEGLSNRIYDTNTMFSIGVFMNMDVEQSTFVANVLTNDLSGYFTFTPILSTNFRIASPQFSNFDMIVTNLSNLEFGSLPVVTINVCPTEQDTQKIKAMYFKFPRL